MVASIPPEDQFTRWRSEYESDILVSLASLAGERLFFGGDNSSGVSGDLDSATMLTGLMEAHWGMGSGVSALPALQRLGITGGTPEDRRGGPGGRGGIGFGATLGARKEEPTGGVLGQRIEQNLARLLEKAAELLTEHRPRVLALAHALESHKTLTGDDVIAVLEGTRGPARRRPALPGPGSSSRSWRSTTRPRSRRTRRTRRSPPRSPGCPRRMTWWSARW